MLHRLYRLILVFCLSLGLVHGQVTPTATGDPGCDLMADIVFVMDSSGSISDADYQHQLEFVDAVAKSFKVGPDAAQISALVYSDHVENLFYFNELYTRQDISQRLLSAPHLKGKTATDKALDFVRLNSFSPGHGARPNVNKIVLVFTDGESDSYTATVEAAKNLKATGAIVNVIGIGPDTDPYELNVIATQQNYIFRVDSHSLLSTIQNEITTTACMFTPLVTPATITTPTAVSTKPKCHELADIIFVFDSSTSISDEDFEKQLTFAGNLTLDFQLGSDEVRFGAVVFGGGFRKEFDLGNFTDHQALLQAVLSISRVSGLTNTAGALNLISDKDMFHSSSGGRDNATKIVILMTDGKSNSEAQTVLAAEHLKNFGVQILSIGIGDDTHVGELSNVASGPENVFQAANYSVLHHIHEDVVHRACELPKNTQKPKCFELADIIFLFDTSGSIIYDDLIKQLNFASNLTRNFELGPNDVRFGAIAFGTNAKKEFDLKDYSDHQTLAQAVASINRLGGNTATGDALNLILDENMFDSSNGGRDNASKIVIVMTDGQSTHHSTTSAAAKKLRDLGIQIISIGIGNADIDELKDIASGSKNVFQAATYDLLPYIHDEVVKRTCELPKNTTQVPTCYELADIIFLFDTSGSISNGDLIKQLNFASNLTKNFELGPNEVRFGAIAFGTTARKEFDLKDYSDHQTLAQAVTAINRIDGNTATGDALKMILDQNMFDSSNGGRDNASKVVIVMTDGKSTTASTTTAEAKKLRDLGIQIISIGIGNADVDELKNIASGSKNVFQAATYDLLPYIHDEVVRRTCDLPKNTTLVPTCYELADIIFLFDTSGSISNGDLIKQLNFASNLTKNFELGPNEVRFGAIAFGTTARKEFDLKDYSDHQTLAQAVTAVNRIDGNTATGDALKMILDQNMFDSSNGGRDNASKVVIVMTDGKSTTASTTTAEAKKLRDLGIQIISIGIGNADVDELKNIASGSKNVFQAATYDLLPYIHDEVVRRTCDLPKNTTLVPTCYELADIIFLFDTSGSISNGDLIKQLNFASNLTKNFELGPNEVRFGAIAFGTTARKEFDLKDYSDHQTLAQAVTAVNRIDGNTATGDALKMILDQNMFDSSNGGRDNASKVVIVMTDGKSTTASTTTAEAKKLRDLGIQIISIGIGNADVDELKNIASGSKNVFQAATYDLLPYIHDEVVRRTCDLPKNTTLVPTCYELADIIFLFDTSGSISNGDLIKQLNFASNLTKNFELGPNEVRFGAIAFGTTARKEFDLKDYSDHQTLAQAVTAVNRIDGNTATGDALKMILDQNMFDSSNGGRDNASKVVIVMTDGKSTTASTTTAEAKKLRDLGIQIISIGIGNADVDELKNIASGSKNVFQAATYDLLPYIHDEVVRRTCDLPKNTTLVPTCYELADIIFLFDTSGSISNGDLIKQLNFASNLTKNFELGPNEVRFGAIAFGTTARKEFDLKDYSDHQTLAQAVTAVNRIDGNTATGDALKMILDQNMFDSSNGGRDNASKVVIVMTDGKSTTASTTTAEAKKLRDLGIQIISIGIGNADVDELKNIASGSKNVFQAATYDLLPYIHDEVVRRTCDLPKNTTLVPTCYELADIIFLFDTSGSISNGDLIKQLNFASNLTKNFELGPNEVRFGAIAFGTTARKEFDLKDYSDHQTLAQAVTAVNRIDGNTATGDALKMILDQNMFDSSNGGRDNASKVVIVMTDGKSTTASTTTAEAKKLRDLGIQIISIGIGNADVDELKNIASGSKNVFQAATYDLLPYIHDEVVRRTCDLPKNTTLVPTCYELADIIFLFDTSGSISNGDLIKQLNFASNLTKNFELGPNEVRFGAIAFGTTARKEFDLKDYSDHQTLAQAVTAINRIDGNTATGDALKMILDQNMFDSSNGGRDNASKVVIVMTDGKSTTASTTTAEAKKLRDLGIQIISIGIGNADVDELKNIASGSKNVFQAATYDLLPYIHDEVVRRTCDLPKNTSQEPTCHELADIIFLFDTSGSINDDDLIKQLNFASDLTKNFELGPNEVRFGAIAFGSTARKEFDLKDYSDHQALAQAVRSIKRLDGTTATGDALNIVLQQNMFDSSAGGRDNASKIVIVMTDGQSTKPKTTTAAAKKLRDLGIQIISIGIGKADVDELNDIASGSKNVFQAATYDLLPYIHDEVVRRSCDLPKNTSQVPTCYELADIIFLFDTSGSISDDDYIKQLNFAKNLTLNFELGPKDVQFGAVAFGKTAQKEFDLKDYSDHPGLSQAIKSVGRLGGTTATGAALDIVLSQDMFGSSSGGRDDASKIVIVMTDGQSTDSTLTTRAAKRLRDQGIQIISIGIGKADINELRDIASGSKNVFQAATYDLLPYIHDEVVRRTCDLPKTNTEVPKCYELADIIFLFDTSGSIKSDDFLKQLEFASNLTQNFELGPKDVQFGAVGFGSVAEIEFNLNDFSDHQALAQAIKAVKRRGISTQTGDAFNLVLNSDMFASASGGRDNASKIVIVMTDGQSTNPQTTLQASKKLRDQGIQIISIGIGNADVDELKNIASGSKNVFQAATYDLLPYIHDEVVTRTCDLPKNTSQEPTCHELADIIFLFDTSGSINDDDLIKQLNFASDLTKNFELGPNEVRFGAIAFGSTARKEFDLKDYSDHQALAQAVRSIKRLDGSTATGDALNIVLQQNMFDSSAGGRDNASKIVIVMTDGQSTKPKTTTAAAKKLRDLGIQIISIGIGKADVDELNDIASGSKNVFQAATYDLLPYIHDEVVRRSCDLPKNTSQVPTCYELADIIFLFDTSGSISDDDYIKQLNFAKNLTLNFELGPKDVQFGAVAFGKTAQKEFDLKDYSDHPGLSQAIKSVGRLGGTTATGAALDIVLSQNMFDSSSGGRDDASKIVIVMTDGQSTDSTLTTRAAKRLRDQGIQIISIGIGKADINELRDIASGSKNVFQAATYDLLPYIHDEVVRRTCDLPKTNTEVPKCYELADIIFLFDTSGSIKSDDFLKQLEFASNLTQNFELGPKDVQFGAVGFGSVAEIEFNLNDFSDHQALAQAIKAVKRRGISTQTGDAFNLVLNSDMFASASGGRDNASKIVIVMTDGQSTNRQTTLQASKKLRDQGIQIISIGIGNADVDELRNIASGSKNVFQAATYDLLPYIHDEVVTRTCDLPKNTSQEPTCHELADIIFLFDTSGSINDDDLIKQLNFASDLTKNFELGPNEVRFGAIAFGSTARKEFDLKDYSDHQALAQAVRSIKRLDGSTATGDALNIVLQQNMFDSSAGGRDNASKIVIVMTDGQSTKPKTTTAAAKKLRDLGIQIISIGIGKADVDELNDIASGSKNVFQAATYDLLPYIHDEVVRRSCDLPKNTSQVPTCYELADIIFLFDTSGSISDDDYIKQLNFAKNLTLNFELGPKDVQFGAVAFGKTAQKEFDLKDYSDHPGLSQAIKSVGRLGGTTATGAALDIVLSQNMFDSSSGGRDDASKIVIVMTDGQSTDSTLTTRAAKRLRDQGIQIISIGIGKADINELRDIASGSKNVFQAATYDLLPYIHDEVVRRTCDLPKTNTEVPKCYELADIIFLFDTSGSIKSDDFLKQLEFASNLTQNFELGPKDVQFGAVGFGSVAEIEFNLNDFSDHQALAQAIKAVKRRGISTQTGDAFNLVLNSDMFASASGGRDNASKIVIVMTDGQSTNPQTTLQASKKLRDQGIQIISIGIGNADVDELKAIASGSKNVFQAATYDLLPYIHDEVVTRTCDLPKNTSQEPTCHELADIIFLFDTSGSINDDDLIKQLNFASDLTKNFELGPNEVRFGAVAFGSTARKEFDLKDYSDHQALAQAVRSIKRLDGTTATGDALNIVLQQNMFDSSAGGRENASKIVIVMTDGQSTKPKTTTAAAKKLRDLGIQIISIGIGNADVDELNDIASGSKNVFQAATYDVLPYIHDEVVRRTCDLPTNTSQAPKCYELADIVFLFDTSGSISDDDYIKQLNFASNLTLSFELGPYDVRFGAVGFGTSVRKEFDLKDYSDHKALTQAVKSVQRLGGNTQTGAALDLVLSQNMFDSSAGGRDNASKIVIVMTDGQSTDPKLTTRAAKNLRDLGIQIISIGIGKADVDELNDIASGSKNVFQAATYDLLPYIHDEVVRRSCDLPKNTSQVPTCYELADIIFLFDTSGSISDDDYIKQLNFAKNLTLNFELGPKDVRFGAVAFGKTAQKEFDLKDYSDHPGLSQAIKSVGRLGGTTATGAALDIVLSQDMFGSSSGGRDDASKIVIVMTDGQSTDSTLTTRAAKRLRDQGIQIISIGIGKADINELRDIASGSKNVFQAATYDLLPYIHDEVVRRTCDLPKTNTEVPKCYELADIIFLFDTSGSITSDDFLKQLEFASNLTQNFELGPKDVQFGAVGFGSVAEIEFNLNDFSDHQALAQAIKAVKRRGISTQTGDAFNLVLNSDMFASASGGRDNASKIVIVMTDGQSTNSQTTLQASKKLRDQGIQIISIGIGNADVDELKAIASGSKNVFQAATYDLLPYIHNEVVKRTCALPKDNTLVPSCNELADIIFVFDTSGSIDDNDLIKQLNFASNMTKNFNLGPNDVQFGAVSFGTSVNKEFDLKDYSDHKALIQAVTSIRRLGGTTNTGFGLNTVLDQNMFRASAGGRSNASKIVIVMTDGKSTIPSLTLSAAKRLRDQGIQIISIGVGKADADELKDIASDRKNVFQAATYDLLPYIHNEVVKRTCALPKDLKKMPFEPEIDIKQCEAVADIVFVVDSSASIVDADYKLQLNFVNELTEHFAIGPDAVQMAVVIFSRDSEIVFDLDDYKDHVSMSKAILGSKHLKGGTYTNKALKLVREKLLTSVQGARSGVPKIVITLTDGGSSSQTETKKEAELLKAEGVTMIAIGIDTAKQTELLNIASKPDNVFKVNDYDVLDTIQQQVAHTACDQVPKCYTAADILFIMDATSNIGLDGFKTVKNFVANLVDNFKIGPDAVQVSVSTFGNYPRRVFDFDKYWDKTALKNAITSTGYMYINTTLYPEMPLKLAREESFSITHGSRPNVPKIAVLIMGASSANVQETIKESNLLKNSGVLIMTVGVGNTQLPELEKIASTSQVVFQVSRPNDLQSIEREVSTKACEVVKTVQGNDDPGQCAAKADILFIVEASNRLNDADYKKLLDFVASYMDKFSVGLPAVQFSAMIFSKAAQSLFDFDEYLDHNSLNFAIKNAPHLSSTTKTWKALELARIESFTSNHGSRHGVPKVAIVITRGDSSDRKETVAQAKLLRDSGVLVVSTGIGSSIRQEIEPIATGLGYVFKANDVDSLSAIENNAVTTVCNYLTSV